MVTSLEPLLDLIAIFSPFACFHADILEGCDAVARENPALSAQLEALADLKFTYVVSCQMYGLQKSSGDPHAKDVLDLMIR